MIFFPLAKCLQPNTTEIHPQLNELGELPVTALEHKDGQCFVKDC